jgi:DNA-binding PadR family transcriptional regulator
VPRRKPGTLLPLEIEVLKAVLSLREDGQHTVHGFGLAHTLRERSGSRALTAHGTLYKALGRLEERELLSSRWEDPAAAEGRPRRRLYALTAEGARVAGHARTQTAGTRAVPSTSARPEPA